MHLILSRKGFDSSCGGAPSPILPDGNLLSLPIPSPHSPIRYEEIRFRGDRLGPLVEHLTHGRVRRDQGAHLDPDLRARAYPRLPGWRPLFGQDGTAQAHLANSGVGVGDLFLFFGWFRRADRTAGGYRFIPGARDLHVLFGWLQVGGVIPLKERRGEVPSWSHYHPHLHGDADGRNTLYVARETLELPGIRGVPGGGVFKQYQETLCLTAPGETRTGWRLPRWFFPRDGREPLTYHGRRERWRLEDEHALLRSVPRGQEFVLDVEAYPEAVDWVRRLVTGESG
jgi:hypothetical protein